jgi:P4 family phage/plasmid primase-like protien
VRHVDFFDNGFLDLIPIRKGDKRPTGRWTEVKATRQDVEAWQSGNLGLRTARFPCVDIDVLDAELSDRLAGLAMGVLGKAPMRTGLLPKRALLYKSEAPFPKQWIQFERGAESYRVEVLAGGQYVVVAGQHPSGSQYLWDVPPAVQDLEWITAPEVQDYLEQVATMVQEHGYTVVGKKDQATVTEVPQDDLKGTLREVTDAVRSLPNTTALFPSRDDYLRLAVAIKAALPDHEAEAFGLFAEWCARWDGGVNDPAIVKRDWDSLRAPYRVGAPFLYDLAQQHGAVNRAAEDFAAMPLEEAPAGPDPDEGAPMSHAWFAARFRARHGAQVRYCPGAGGWLRWDGSRWAADDTRKIQEWAGQVCRDQEEQIKLLANNPSEARSQCRYASSVQAIEHTLDYASHHESIAVPFSAFDADPWLLNTPGGVVKLKDGTMIPNDPAYLFTKQTAVSPRAMPTPKWSAFLKEATNHDVQLEAYLQRLSGYAATGSTREHVLAFLYGPGGNGKGVFLNTLVRALGSYAAVSAMDTFTASRYDKHPADLAALAGSRLVTAQETQEGRSWDEAKVKSITGGDPVSARFMRENFFVFVPQFKLVFSGNHKPRLHNVDDAMKRRFHLVPFTVTPKVVNKNLTEELEAELPGILQWIIEGCIAWQQEGLKPPRAVLAATESYFMDEDAPGRWLSERCDPAPKAHGARELYSDWCAWCSENGEEPGSFRTFTSTLRGRGIAEGRTATARGFLLSLRKAVAEEVFPTSTGGDLVKELLA